MNIDRQHVKRLFVELNIDDKQGDHALDEIEGGVWARYEEMIEHYSQGHSCDVGWYSVIEDSLKAEGVPLSLAIRLAHIRDKVATNGEPKPTR